MTYSTAGSSIFSMFAGLGVVSMVLGLVFFLFHIVFVISMIRMANDKGQNGMIYGILAFFLGEIAFLLLSRKDDSDYDDDDYEDGSSNNNYRNYGNNY